VGLDGPRAPLALQIAGVVLLAGGIAVLAHTVIRFAVEGIGMPFPAAPTENLVVGGAYRYVRNAMYLGAKQPEGRTRHRASRRCARVVP
jgi:protein-S-isoprenylcysteine O-methyltransferase Ste14